MLFNFALNTPLGGPKTTRKVWNWIGHTIFWPMLMTLISWEKTQIP
jgi:hypothetical protein